MRSLSECEQYMKVETHRAADATLVGYYSDGVKNNPSASQIVKFDSPFTIGEGVVGTCRWVRIPNELGIVPISGNIDHDIGIVDAIAVRKEIADLENDVRIHGACRSSARKYLQQCQIQIAEFRP